MNQTLEQGLELLNSLIDTLAAEKATVVPGSEVFKLYDTYGFPWELTEEIASERGFTIDHEAVSYTHLDVYKRQVVCHALSP